MKKLSFGLNLDLGSNDTYIINFNNCHSFDKSTRRMNCLNEKNEAERKNQQGKRPIGMDMDLFL